MYRIAMSGVEYAASMVGGLEDLPDTTQALHYLRLIATSDAQVAHWAVQGLGTEMGPRGLSVARELFDQDLVHERNA